MAMRSRHLRRALPLALLAAAAVLAACSSDSSGPGDTRLSGLWTLDAIDSAPLPFVLRSAQGGSYDVLGGTLQFDGQVMRDSLRFGSFDAGGAPSGTPASTLERAIYELHEDGVFLVTRVRSPVGFVDTGVVVGDTIALKEHRIEQLTPDAHLLRYVRSTPQ